MAVPCDRRLSVSQRLSYHHDVLRIEELHERGLHALRRSDYTEARRLFKTAGAVCEDDDAAAEKIATLLIAVDVMSGTPSADQLAELAALTLAPTTPLNGYLASYYLAIYYSDSRDTCRAQRYAETMSRHAHATEEPARIVAALVLRAGMSSTAADGRPESLLRQALAVCEGATSDALIFWRAIARHNLGYTLLMHDHTADAIGVLLCAATELQGAAFPPTYRAEALINLAFAYLRTDQLDECLRCATAAASITPLKPHVGKYVHYLRGEAYCRRGEISAARNEFQELSTYYPGFTSLSDLLLAVDVSPILSLDLI